MLENRFQLGENQEFPLKQLTSKSMLRTKLSREATISEEKRLIGYSYAYGFFGLVSFKYDSISKWGIPALFSLCRVQSQYITSMCYSFNCITWYRLQLRKDQEWNLWEHSIHSQACNLSFLCIDDWKPIRDMLEKIALTTSSIDRMHPFLALEETCSAIHQISLLEWNWFQHIELLHKWPWAIELPLQCEALTTHSL